MIYTDGAARGNPGPSASGYRIYDARGNVAEEKEVYNGIKTNNFAEYTAVILALKWCAERYKPDEVDVELYSDSELVIRQLKGHYKVKAEGLKELHQTAKDIAKRFKSITLNNLPREHHGIKEVDKRLNILLDNLGK